MATTEAQSGPARLSKQARREQLLDSAADLLLERGAAALTMEGLAAHAGVSKALPYAHFDNSDAVLVALYQREVRRLGARVRQAVEGLRRGDERVAASVRAYFDVVSERGAVLGVLSGSTVVQRSDDGSRTGHRFVADLLRESFPLSKKEAMAAAVMTQAVLAGGVEAWVRGDASRAAIEAMAVRAITAVAGSNA